MKPKPAVRCTPRGLGAHRLCARDAASALRDLPTDWLQAPGSALARPRTPPRSTAPSSAQPPRQPTSTPAAVPLVVPAMHWFRTPHTASAPGAT
eukprot:1373560-Rhodomonas_salina.1